VSIGLAVYNGGRYLGAALDSLVTQDYADFEIILSDNASDDETEAICREHAARDPRIRYSRNERNMGALWNAVRVYELARGEYFMWAAHDDLRDPQYLSRCVAALESNPRALFCCTGVKLIDADGHDISDTFRFRSYPPIGATPRERFRALIRSTSWLHVYSLIRTPALGQTKLGNYMWGGDVVLVADLCLRGEVAYVPEKLFDYRYFATKTNEELASGISTSETVVKVSWSDLAANLMESVRRSPLSRREKLRLKWMIIFELCIRNAGFGWGMHAEGFEAMRRALAEGKYRRALTLASIALSTQTARFVKRVKRSALYRASKLKKVWFPGEPMSSARKPD
jgi:glycosyltransferase involved in cell wall biosynthesis